MNKSEENSVYSDPTVKRPGLSSKTKQILIGIAGAGALLLGAVLIYSVLVTPERQPYRDALTQYKQVYDANVAFTNAAIALNNAADTEAQTEANVAAIDTTKNALKSKSDALGEQPVLKDGEGKALYATFSDKLNEYIAYNENVLSSRQKVRPVLTSGDCTKAFASTDSYADKTDAVKACADSFEALDGINDADYRSLVNSYAASTAKLVTVFESIAALEDAQGKDAERQKELVAEHDDILAEIEAANKEFASNLQRNKAKVDITAPARALDAYLTRKSSVF